MSNNLPCGQLLLGVSGSIQCTQLTPFLITLKTEFAERIRIIMTETAANMVNPKTVELYTDEPVFVDPWGTSHSPAPHVRLTRWADLFVVMPATANVIGKAANGIADDLLTTAIVASSTPVVFVPAMNPAMFRSPAVTRNIAQLEADGHYVVRPSAHVSVTTGEFDTGLGSSIDEVLPHLWHVLMKLLKNSYWQEAVSSPAATPAEQLKTLPLLASK